MRPNFDVQSRYIGDGTLTDYSFDFKIDALTQLEVIVLDATGVEVKRVRGDDVTYLTGVTFDAVNGGGDVNLLAVLPINYTILLNLADDAPTQPFRFRDLGDFTLKQFEMALDHVVGGLQRAAWLAQRALRVNDAIDLNVTPFNPQLPATLVANKALIINPTNDGVVLGPDADQIAAAQANAVLAQAAAAQATAAAGAAYTVDQKFNLLNNQVATALAGVSFDGAVYTSVELDCEVIGAAFMSNFKARLQYLNGVWRMFDAGLGEDGEPSGVTLTLPAQVGSVVGLNAACDNQGNRTLKIRMLRHAV